MSNINTRFTQPEDWRWGEITPREGQTLRYGWVAPKNPKALCFIFPGLSEYCEKYFEVTRDLIARGFAVAVLDWRGQGLSWRHLPDHEKRHNDDFANDTEDGKVFIEALIKIPALKNLPRVLIGHSMGGHIAMRVMHDLTDVFKCAALTAPMFAINLPLHMESPARMTAEAACRMGWAEHYVFGGSKWSMSVFSNNLNLLTSDTERRAMLKQHMVDDPRLHMGGLTFGWVRAALISTRLTHDPKWLSGITTPTMIAVPEREMIVSNSATRTGARHMPNAELLEIKGSLHEVLMERDTFRNQFWAGFDGLVAKHLGPM